MHKSGNIVAFVDGQPTGRITSERLLYLLEKRGANLTQEMVALNALISGAPVNFGGIYAYVEYGYANTASESVMLANEATLKEEDWIVTQYDMSVVNRSGNKCVDIPSGTEFYVVQVNDDRVLAEASTSGRFDVYEVPIAAVAPVKEIELP
ncbi:hypothetical protein HCJ39_13315 [Listeria rocourtiae]|uniref:hypothetical protein n=1 Tax=Listeria rocourtiae TaxID=647910 RepID=UPI0016254741|nr:hypothetical protein [Listeria rocourtiae]MBC1605694.1 hypothetical protein [Listeria rocourtiae]